MSDTEMLYCLVAFILGWFLCKHMRNGFTVGGARVSCKNGDSGRSPRKTPRNEHICNRISVSPTNTLDMCDNFYEKDTVSWPPFTNQGNICVIDTNNQCKKGTKCQG